MQYIPVPVQNEQVLRLNCKTWCMFHTWHCVPLNRNAHLQTTEHLPLISVALSAKFDFSSIATEMLERDISADAANMFEQILP